MNQVYFYIVKTFKYIDCELGLNPFMNQVYFYRASPFTTCASSIVLIPL